MYLLLQITKEMLRKESYRQGRLSSGAVASVFPTLPTLPALP